ncbi:ABC transporter ATP-binding protein [Paenibacillus sp. GCM10012307]|uniref:ABC transporter ATP-binding protein n=1 Tax=Paenibacillus roseus TaxID=2798579 RepID=A0A934IVZ6_9BACL|nr:ABC transporter ATP-binding protein [Paenibacillus roseus]MBJ6360316.1 ABC transporter ATP-binding protein [Paenibacillus roseus]
MIALFKHLKPYTRFILIILVSMLAGILLELYLPTLMASIVDIGIVDNDMGHILQTGGWMVVCSLLAGALTVIVTYFTSRVSVGFGRDLRRKLFIHVEGLSLQEFDRFGTASLITRTTNDIKQIQDVVNMMFGMMIRAPIMLIGGIILAVSRDAMLSLIFLASLPVLACLIFLIMRTAIPLFRSLQNKTDRLNLLLRESLTGLRVIRAFNRTDYEKKRFDQANEDYRDIGIKVNRMIAVLFPVMMIVMNFTNVAIVWFGGIRVNEGVMQVGNMIAFLQYAMMILMSLIMLSVAFIMIPRAQASATRINEVIQLHSQIKEPAQPESGKAVQGLLEFKDVTFRYAGAERAAVESVSFVARPGETTAIIGSTGSGKTTLLQLIPRFYDVERGSIEVDGVNIRDMSQKELRAKLGYVPQKAALFRGTIADNIRFGNGDIPQEQLEAALATAQAAQFVSAKEGGINAEVSQAGGNLSGGQKQRLSIARALARKPEIYLFDDSFSALDYKTDAKLRAALRQETGQATVIIVAQRVSTVIDADQIIVLDEGKVAGIGKHDELLKGNRIYQEIVASQQTEGASA